MDLQRIVVKNYKSIEEVPFEIEKVAGSRTYTLIGINEAGKTSFLNALSLFDDTDASVSDKDYFDRKQAIEIIFTYQLEQEDEENLREELRGKIPEVILQKIEPIIVSIKVSFEAGSHARMLSTEASFKKHKFSSHTILDEAVTEKTDESQPDFDIKEYLARFAPDWFWVNSPHISLWRSEERYLINNQINLAEFAEKPTSVSVPLTNCFHLAGFSDIKSEIASIKGSFASTHNLQERLADAVTEHIKSVWPDHPVRIKFQIDNMLLTFLIEDDEVKYEAKTTDQRSDGFKQLISFLLSISAENKVQQLEDTVLLLDEPETHLHPKAQEYLKEELIKITQNSKNNIVFFATHSNYMIDRENINRCYRVSKKGNRKTCIERIEASARSYAQVNYEVFGIVSADYHNELYGFIEAEDAKALEELKISKTWHNDKSGKDEKISLSKYVRNSIHHPENTKNEKPSTAMLNESIRILINLKNEVIARGAKARTVSSGTMQYVVSDKS